MGIGKPFRLRVDSNFGDGDCGAGEIYTHAPEISRRRDERRFSRVTSPRNIARGRVYFARPTIRDYSQSTNR